MSHSASFRRSGQCPEPRFGIGYSLLFTYSFGMGIEFWNIATRLWIQLIRRYDKITGWVPPVFSPSLVMIIAVTRLLLWQMMDVCPITRWNAIEWGMNAFEKHQQGLIRGPDRFDHQPSNGQPSLFSGILPSWLVFISK